MILARLTRAICQQNWFAVALEFVIVIAGVVIGFQVTAWNAERQDHAREGLILCRLARDFDQIEADVRQHLADAQTSQAAAEAIVAAAQAGLTPEILDGLDIDRALALRVAPAGSPTYAQLVSSGDMALIRSEAVREALIAYHEQLSRFQRSGDSLATILYGSGARVFDIRGLTSQSIAALPETIQADVLNRLADPDVYTAARGVAYANMVNFDWKTTLVEDVAWVNTELAAYGAGCANEAAP
ncbi:hypothetical protein L2D01_08585 [Hyphomonadaceae bacterium ML37]|nr:hypothetical protein L2D01_08585 [Hyphomonadaceae bacterium ML37]